MAGWGGALSVVGASARQDADDLQGEGQEVCEEEDAWGAWAVNG